MIQENHFTRLKDQSDDFPFLLNARNAIITNYLTGDPALPLIGKYSRNQYHFLGIDSAILLPPESQLNLPIQIRDVLQNIPHQISHNKPDPNKKKETKKQSKKGKKQQQQQQQQQMTLDQFIKAPEQQEIQQEVQQEDHVPDFHPLQFNPSNQIKFTWTVSSLKDQKILQPLKQEPCLSYVNHNWVFEQISFEFQKKLTALIPICVCNPINVKEYSDSYKGLSFNGLRSEYMSVHLGQGGSLCFSPNNMKVTVDLKAKLISFWTVILQEDNIHSVYYHWVILDPELSEMSKVISKESKSVIHLIENYRNLGQEFNVQCDELMHLFQL